MNDRAPISIFLPSLGGGGAERVMVTLANEFAKRGCSVDLVLAHATGPYLANVSQHVSIVDLRRNGVLASLLPLAAYLRRRRPAALLSAMSHANVIALMAHLIARTPARMVVSERSSLAASFADQRRLRDRAMQSLMRTLYGRADRVTVVSHGMMIEVERMLGVEPDRIRTIYNPVVSAELIALSHEQPPHAWLADPTTPTIVAAGRLSPEKQFDVLIRAFARLRATRDVRLVILGEGGQRAALTRLIGELGMQDSIALPGFATNPFSAMRRARLFVLSSRLEGSPNALVQAMACGTPVVSTDCPTGPREILEDGRFGRLVPVGDDAALAAAMSASLDEPTPSGLFERASEFNVDRAVDAYLELLLGGH